MKVTILNKTKQFDNIDGVFMEIQTFLSECLKGQDIYFSHFIIDGVEIYSDYEFYIEDHINEIESIKIEVKTALQFSKDIVDSIHHYTEKAIREIKILADSFYQASISESWQKLNDLLEAVQWIHEAILTIDKENSKPSDWDKYYSIVSSFEAIFPELLQALESQDNIFVADILTHEILPLFKELNQLRDVGYSQGKEHFNHAEGEH